ncbi:hypothetical protein SAMN04488065_0140 [Haloplanus vescus]|uniref:Uncharacterized protein n=1 Tax=Haloplanus vescus TaxID=555874 RepID=A0A1H3VP84_9EURY|nr:hypothetical protein [Haloplanus vescus]SDZ76559.1 hypothetical protein SAMN04488065_0140 [Haloplanus vescus]
MPSRRLAAASLAVGALHATLVLLVALHLGYDVGPSNYSVLGAGWRYGGLVVVAAVPAWLALRARLLTPLAALAVTTGYVLWRELTPPGPSFHDVAEFERLAEPTGITVVENGLYAVHYMTDATVWTVGFLFLGALEYAARTEWDRLPPVSVSWPSLPLSPRRARAVAAVGGLLHAAVMVWFAHRLGVTLTGGFDWLLYPFGLVGQWLLAAVPLYLLARHRLFAPATLLAAFVLLDARAELQAGVESPHALYFGAWFVFLGIALAAGGVEYAGRRLQRRVSA